MAIWKESQIKTIPVINVFANHLHLPPRKRCIMKKQKIQLSLESVLLIRRLCARHCAGWRREGTEQGALAAWDTQVRACRAEPRDAEASVLGIRRGGEVGVRREAGTGGRWPRAAAAGADRTRAAGGSPLTPGRRRPTCRPQRRLRGRCCPRTHSPLRIFPEKCTYIPDVKHTIKSFSAVWSPTSNPSPEVSPSSALSFSSQKAFPDSTIKEPFPPTILYFVTAWSSFFSVLFTISSCLLFYCLSLPSKVLSPTRAGALPVWFITLCPSL